MSVTIEEVETHKANVLAIRDKTRVFKERGASFEDMCDLSIELGEALAFATLVIWHGYES